MLVDDVYSNKVNNLKYGLIVDICKILLQNFNNGEVVFIIRRQAKENTHALAMTTLSLTSHIMFDVIPNCNTTIILFYLIFLKKFGIQSKTATIIIDEMA